LVHGREATDDSMILYLDVAGEGPIIRKNYRVTDGAIMSDVRIGEKIAAAANPGFSRGSGAAIDRNELTKGIVVADFEEGRFAFIFQILCLLADRAVGVKPVAAPGDKRPPKGDVMLEPTAFA
jgi:hypothetical protein